MPIRLAARAAAFAAVTLVAAAGPALAETVERTGTFGGLDLSYRVALPDAYDPAASYPTILHFAGGGQTERIVTGSLASDWESGAAERGYVVVAPIAPDGRLFFQDGDAVFPEFLDFILSEYHPAGGRLHVTGHSNGGLSAFHVASLYPDYFVSVTGYPGYLYAAGADEAAALAPLCIFMHVGEEDPSWLAAMQRQADQFRGFGYRVAFSVEPGQIHRLDVTRDGLSERLWAEIESSADGCG